MKKEFRSLILKYFSKELYLDLFKVTKIPCNTNERIRIAKEVLKKHGVPFDGLGSGTNRFGVIIDGYTVKIAVDEDGMIDNMREFKYTMDLFPYVTKTYECIPTGLVLVAEYVTVFDHPMFLKYRSQMKDTLKAISDAGYLIGDVGLDSKNFCNWGIRMDGTICILDFAYIYDLSYRTFTCGCDNYTIPKYNSTFTMMKCPKCGKEYTFGDIRLKITRKIQQEEIGDIRNYGYNLTSPKEIQETRAEFQPEYFFRKKKKKEETEVEKFIRETDEENERLDKQIEEQGIGLDIESMDDYERETYAMLGFNV